MLLKSLLTLLLATTALAGDAIIKNKCGVPLYITTVSSTSSGTTKVPPNGYLVDKLFSDPLTGVAIKITSTPDGLGNGKPILHLSYTLSQHDKTMYYDLSSAYGFDDVFKGKKLVLRTNEEKKCPVITWWGTPDEGNTKGCPGLDGDLWLDLCV